MDRLYSNLSLVLSPIVWGFLAYRTVVKSKLLHVNKMDSSRHDNKNAVSYSWQLLLTTMAKIILKSVFLPLSVSCCDSVLPQFILL